MTGDRRGGLPSPYPAALPRRLLTVTVVWVAAALALVLSPLVVAGAAVADLVLRRRGWPTLRMVAFFGAFLWIEVTSHLRLVWALVTRPFARRSPSERDHELIRWWVGRLHRAARRVIGLRIEVDGPDDLGPGPLLVFAQHVSIVDAITPVYVLAVQRGWRPRHVLARGLRFDPCIDIVGHRLPNHFVARGSADNSEGLATIRQLASGMEDDEAAVIFPGGSLFTPAVLARALEKLAERGSPQLTRARTYRHVLPPRPGGVQAFFDGAPDAHVLVVGHVGFEPVASIKRLWRVLPLTEPVELKVWRHDRAEVPADPDARLDWLYDRWAEVDDWIDERRRARSDGSMATA